MSTNRKRAMLMSAGLRSEPEAVQDNVVVDSSPGVITRESLRTDSRSTRRDRRTSVMTARVVRSPLRLETCNEAWRRDTSGPGFVFGVA